LPASNSSLGSAVCHSAMAPPISRAVTLGFMESNMGVVRDDAIGSLCRYPYSRTTGRDGGTSGGCGTATFRFLERGVSCWSDNRRDNTSQKRSRPSWVGHSGDSTSPKPASRPDGRSHH
jgi:hypothetical protein